MSDVRSHFHTNTTSIIEAADKLRNLLNEGARIYDERPRAKSQTVLHIIERVTWVSNVLKTLKSGDERTYLWLMTPCQRPTQNQIRACFRHAKFMRRSSVQVAERREEATVAFGVFFEGYPSA